jgi:hypothetical protein
MIKYIIDVRLFFQIETMFLTLIESLYYINIVNLSIFFSYTEPKKKLHKIALQNLFVSNDKYISYLGKHIL